MTESEKLNQELVEDLAEMELMKLNPTFGGVPLSDKHKKYFLHEIRSRRWELGIRYSKRCPPLQRLAIIR